MKNEISKILNLITSGNIEKGFRESKELYLKNLNNLSAIKLMVYAYIQIGNFQRVVEFLDEKFSHNEDNKDFDYYNNLGYSLVQIEEYERSIPILKKAMEIKPNYPGPFASIAAAFQRIRDFEQADHYVSKALENVISLGEESYSTFMNVFLLKSEVNSALNRDTETFDMFQKLLNKQFNENIFYILTLISPQNIQHNLVQTAEQKLNINSNKFHNKLEKFNYLTPIYFGLANYYQKFDKARSEKFYELGNAEIFNSSRYNSHEYQQKILQSIEIFNKDYLDYEENDTNLGSQNFFIIGSPRSGTTLLESFITANEYVFGAGELISAKSLIENYISRNQQNLDEFKKIFQSTYLNRTFFLKNNYPFVVDKMPENFLYIGFIKKLLPSSKFIRVLRDPWDIAISLFKQRYIANIPYSVSFFNIGIFLANFEAINRFWDSHITEKNLLNIRYEDLVSDQKGSLLKIYNFLQIKPDSYNDEKRKNYFSPTASIRQIKDKIHIKSVDKHEFMNKKNEFDESLQMQRQFWISKGILDKKDNFYGYI